MPPLLCVDRLTTGYGRIEVIHDLTFDVPEGAVVALLGPNGAGKSTVLRALSGGLPVWRGSVRFCGRRIDGRTPYAIATSGLTLVPEGRGVFPGLTCADHLAIAARASRSGPSRVEEALDAFPALREMKNRKAGTMSGGEQQMLALSRAFIAKPRLLLLDEISMGLAPIIVDRLYDGVTRLRDSGVTLLVVEQHLTHALAVADLVYVMAKGRIAFVGEPGELQASTMGDQYLTTVASGPVVDGG